MQISHDAVATALRPVTTELAERYPGTGSAFDGCLLTAAGAIEFRLNTAALAEGVTADRVDDSAQHRLADCVVNYALALLGASRRTPELRALARDAGVTTALDWVRLRNQNDRGFSPLVFFEQWVIDGHPLHPAAKVRLGMSPADVLDTCPDWGNVVDLPVAMLRSDHAVEVNAFTDLLLTEHPALGRELAAGRVDRSAVTLIPLHPWQAEHILPKRYATELGDGAIGLLRTPIKARPLISYRTLAPLPTSASARPSHLKTALSVRLTNALRGVSPGAAHNGPAVSRLLRQILQRERGFGGRLSVMPEHAAARFQSIGGAEPSAVGDRATLGRDAAMAALARGNPELDLADGELLLPVSALWARSPISGTLFLAELLKEVRCNIGGDPGSPATGRNAAALRFVQQYARVCLPPLLTLLTRYGIALEAHGENTVLVIRDGLPVRCVVRDFGGIRVHEQRLARAGLSVTLRPGSDIATADSEQLRNKLYYALFVNDLRQLVRCLSACGGQPQATLWRAFGSVAHETFAELATHSELTADAAADRAALLEQPWPNKALLTMWLRGDVTDYTYLPTPNPFAVPGVRR